MKYIKQLDAFRFFGFMSVFIGHILHKENLILAKFPFGFGVNLFFVLSGFLITKLLLNYRYDNGMSQKTALKTFYFRRVLRIFPIYYLTIVFLYFIQFQNYKEVTTWMLFYASNFYISLSLPYLGSYNHLWSLAIEEQFYFIWPFLILFLPKRYLLRSIYFIILISLVFKTGFYIYKGGWHPAINAQTISCMDSFGLGGLISYWDRFNKNILTRRINKWLLLFFSIIFLTFMVYFPIPSYPFIPAIYSNFLFSFISFFLLMPASQDAYRGWLKKIIENKILIHLGKISYGLYLYHLFMPDLYNFLIEKEIIQENGYVIKFFICLFLCITISEISWHVIEKPISRIKTIV